MVLKVLVKKPDILTIPMNKNNDADRPKSD